MSLKPESLETVPPETVSVAKAAFPRGNPYLRIRDEFGPIYRDEDFAELYSHRGQPGYSPGRLALVTVFQYMENLSDRQAAEAVRARLDWKYALGLALTDSGFDHTVLCEFRSRLVRTGVAPLLLDRLLVRLEEAGLAKPRGRQRTDSTHVLAAIRTLNRLELLGETMRAALNELAGADPEWTSQIATSEWVKRYGPRVEDSRLPESKAGRGAYVETVGQDGFLLLDRIAEQKPRLLNLPKTRALQSVWNEHLERSGQTICLTDRRKKAKPKPSKEISSEDIPGPEETGSIESPYDLQARYCRRAGTEWTGYHIHLSETCDNGHPRIVTHVETTVANVHEARCMRTIQKSLVEKKLAPSIHLADAAYVSADLLTESWQDWKIRLLGPPRKNPTWQAKTPGAYTHEDFRVDWDNQTATCPQGKQSSSWGSYSTSSGERIRASFRKSDCGPCSARALCTKAETRNLALRPRPEYEALQAVRSLLASEDGKQIYKLRAGVESSISQGVRRCGLRRSRYWGLAKTHLQHVATAAALNLTRVGAWLADIPLAKTRISRFARLAG